MEHLDHGLILADPNTSAILYWVLRYPIHYSADIAYIDNNDAKTLADIGIEILNHGLG